MVAKPSNELILRHENLLARLRVQVFRRYTMEQFRFQSCEVMPPINGHTWECPGGLKFGYTNPFGIGVAFEIKYENDSEFIIFVTQTKPQSFTFGNRSCHFGNLDSQLFKLSNEYWQDKGIRMGMRQ